MVKTACTQCTAVTKDNLRCKLQTCKWSPKCFVHRDVEIGTSRIPNSGDGVFAKRDLKNNEIIAQYTVGTIPLTKSQLDAKYPGDTLATHTWMKNGNLYYDAVNTTSVAGMFNSCRTKDKKEQPTFCKGNNAKLTQSGSIKTLKSIEQGQEIFISYGKTYWGNSF